MALRKYQQDAVDSLYSYFEKHDEGNPVIAMPTGTGKSHVIGEFAAGAVERWPSTKITMLTHVKELIQQNAEKVPSHIPLGIYSAGLRRRELGRSLTYAGIQSVHKLSKEIGKQDLILIDECHLVSASGSSMYEKFLEVQKDMNPKLRVIGLSATIYRMGMGLITEGDTFDHVCHDVTNLTAFNRFLDDAYLSPLIPKKTDTEIDLSGVGKRGGEFISTQLQEATDIHSITSNAVTETLDRAWDRDHILVFASGVKHTEHVASEFARRGVSVGYVHSKMHWKLRDKIIAAFKRGEIRVLVNNGILTTGFDFPALNCLVILRATDSPGLWVQILGRGTRPYYVGDWDLADLAGRLAAIEQGGKLNCLVLDFAANTARLGPVNDPRIPKKKGDGSGEAPIKLCETHRLVTGIGCGTYNHAGAKWCGECHNEFRFEVKVQDTASTIDLIAKSSPKVETFLVDRITYSVHKKVGKNPSLKVSYYCGMMRYTEWVAAWHETNVRHLGKKWWDQRTDIPLPATAEDACEVAHKLQQPTHVRVWINKKHPEVMSHVFA